MSKNSAVDRARRRHAALAGIAIASLLLPACTRVKSYALDAGKPQAGMMPAGFSYWLPKSAVTVSAGLVLTDCEIAAGFAGHDPKVPPPVVAIGFKLVGEIDAKTQRGQQVLLDYRSMMDFLKTGSLAVERHDNGMLKSVNAELADESPEVLAALAKAAVSIAALTAGGPALPAVAASALTVALNSPQRVAYATKSSQTKDFDFSRFLLEEARLPVSTREIQYPTCSLEAFRWLAEYRVLKDQADATDNKIDEATATLAELLAQPGGLSGINLVPLRNALKVLKDAAARKTVLDARMAKNVAARTLPLEGTGNVTDPNGSSFGPKDADRQAFVARLFTTSRTKVKIIDGSEMPLGRGGDDLSRTQLQFGSQDVTTQFISDGNIGDLVSKLAKATAKVSGLPGQAIPQSDLPKAGTPIDMSVYQVRPERGFARAGNGIVYVEPRKARITLSGPALDIATDKDGQPRVTRDASLAITYKPDVAVATQRASFPEFGQFLTLPLTSGFGQKSALEATFAEDGSLVKGKFGRSASVGKALATSAQTVAEQAVAFRAAREARELAVVENRLKQLNAEKALDAAENPPKPEEKAAIDIEIAATAKLKTLKETQVAIAQANKTLNELEAAAKPPAPSP